MKANRRLLCMLLTLLAIPLFAAGAADLSTTSTLAMMGYGKVSRFPDVPSTTVGLPSLYSGAGFTCSRVSSSMMR